MKMNLKFKKKTGDKQIYILIKQCLSVVQKNIKNLCICITRMNIMFKIV